VDCAVHNCQIILPAQTGGEDSVVFGDRKRCAHGACSSGCMGAGMAAIFVVCAATLACLSSFLRSVGVPLSSDISTGFHLTWVSFVIILVWMVSIGFNVRRKHEDALWCFVDSVGLPTIVLSLPDIAILAKATAEKIGG